MVFKSAFKGLKTVSICKIIQCRSNVIAVCGTGGMLMTEETRSTVRTASPSATSSTTNLTRTGPQSNPRCLCQRPAVDRLSQGTACNVTRTWTLATRNWHQQHCQKFRVLRRGGRRHQQFLWPLTEVRYRGSRRQHRCNNGRMAVTAGICLWGTTAHDCRAAGGKGKRCTWTISLVICNSLAAGTKWWYGNEVKG